MVAARNPAKRPLRPLGRRGPAMETGFECNIKIHGFGYSQVDVLIPRLGLEARLARPGHTS